MKIAQVSPLYESVPPKVYGGTERVVSFLTEELVRQGHEVTLFASGDSLTKANLISPCNESLRLNSSCIDQLAHHVLMLEMVEKMKKNFEIIHYHIDYLHFPFSRRSNVPNVTTLHGKLNIPDLNPLYKEFSEIPVVSISSNQRNPLPEANWYGTVYHGIPKNLFRFNNKGGDYLGFLGRISPEKRVDRAIEIAIRCDMPIRIAAKIDKVDLDYFKKEIEHLFDHPLVDYIGEINDFEKNEFIGNSKAILFPIDWPEPFGLVMIESMACGTPVVAYKNGSVPEIIDEGETGFMVDSIEKAVEVVKNKVPVFNRKLCRKIFELKFSAQRMATDYLKLYEKVIFSHKQHSLQLLNRL